MPLCRWQRLSWFKGVAAYFAFTLRWLTVPTTIAALFTWRQGGQLSEAAWIWALGLQLFGDLLVILLVLLVCEHPLRILD